MSRQATVKTSRRRRRSRRAKDALRKPEQQQVAVARISALLPLVRRDRKPSAVCLPRCSTFVGSEWCAR